VPLALNSGLFWPRRSLMRYSGTIVIEILDPYQRLPRAEARQLIQSRIETACQRLIAEARSKPNPPPLPDPAVVAAAAPRPRRNRNIDRTFVRSYIIGRTPP
jgi:1-acyl-sn-glycerol-3-phosphate acyltransferase